MNNHILHNKSCTNNKFVDYGIYKLREGFDMKILIKIAKFITDPYDMISLLDLFEKHLGYIPNFNDYLHDPFRSFADVLEFINNQQPLKKIDQNNNSTSEIAQ